jgi:ribosomal protein S18 acetylase RimI-like enzyme
MIRRLEESDWEALKSLRLEALETEPQSFAADVEEYRSYSSESWVSRARGTPHSFIVGAFVSDYLVGMGGFRRELGAKTHHKGSIWGMYVSPPHRRKHIGGQTLNEVLQEARRMKGLEQVALSVVTINTAAIQLYKKYGFRSFGTEARALRVGGLYLDEDHMILPLS